MMIQFPYHRFLPVLVCLPLVLGGEWSPGRAAADDVPHATAGVVMEVEAVVEGELVAEPVGVDASAQLVGLQLLDWALIVLYAASTICLGLYFSRRQKSTGEYFVGSGNMNPILIGVSLFATLLSTISYLSMPGESAGKGPVLLVGQLAMPLVYLIVSVWLLPHYMRQRVTSAYELLETRLGLSVRLLGSVMFLLLRLVWMTLLVYMAAKAMVVMMGLDPRWIPLVVLVTGFVSIIYTSLGGLRAVVITDLMQTLLLFGGALLVLATVTYDFGGFGWFPSEWRTNWDTQPFFPTDLKTRVSVIGTILSVTVWYVATSGGDQTSVQRFMATKDTAAARRALATQLTVGVVVALTLYAVGFALLGYFERHPEYLPAGMNVKDHADELFPRFIAYHLPIGISGLVVSAMFAAAMSSIDSGVNSITAVVMTDFLDRFGLKPVTEKWHVRAARVLAFGIGTIVVLGSTFMKYIEGNITEVTGKTVNLLTTPIFALFFFAVFVRRASPVGVWVGAICGTLTALAIAFSGPLVYALHVHLDIDPGLFDVALITKGDPATGATWTTAEDPISFQWIGPVALIVNLTTGYLACLLFPRHDEAEAKTF
jgi:solute:Na+ symporter, SSS family